MRLGLRYDMRAPEWGAPIPDLYRTAIDQCAWADALGFEAVHIAEHHAAEDNYLPAPIVFASAIAARTESIRIQLSALCVTMHDPLRLAEDLAILDHISGGGRVAVVAGMGYRPREFEMFGIDYARRGEIFEDKLGTLLTAWRADAFDYLGRKVSVTPKPVGSGPEVFIGGTGPPSARRAARMGLGYIPASKALHDLYLEECARVGHANPNTWTQHSPTFVHIAEDTERAWELVGPHLLHAANLYAQWGNERPNSNENGTWRAAETVDALKADPNNWVVTPEECLQRLLGLDDEHEFRFHPLLGGLDPDVSWSSLRLFESEVLPELVAQGRCIATGR